ncbi:MAG TPA: hypothetical protein VHU43_03715, partial [Steroidobacteraceae bacterium]|nr:hypothetical protein [Steroidobacteraceae bacterium]
PVTSGTMAPPTIAMQITPEPSAARSRKPGDAAECKKQNEDEGLQIRRVGCLGGLVRTKGCGVHQAKGFLRMMV